MFLNLGYVMGSREHEEVSKLSENVQRIVWYYLYTQDLKLNDSDFAALPAVIIHMTLIVATQCSGNFLQTIWAAKMVDVSIENVYFLTEKLFKLILGKEKYEEYSF